MEKIKVNFSVSRKEMTTEEFILYSKNLISKLSDFDKLFESANFVDVLNKKNYFFKKDLSDFDFHNLYTLLKEDDVAYKNKNSDNQNLHSDSMSWTGFTVKIFFGGKNNIHSIPNVSLRISQGSYEDIPASINIEYYEKGYNHLTNDYFIKLIKLIEQFSDLCFANIITNDFFLKVRQRGQKSIGWINYSNNKKLMTRLNVDDIITETKKGFIFSLSENMPSIHDKQLILKSVKISNVLANL